MIIMSIPCENVFIMGEFPTFIYTAVFTLKKMMDFINSEQSITAQAVL